ncbi:MAG: site-specific DNA-methyltransferase [Candidatus Zixiibacteriota bacterium]
MKKLGANNQELFHRDTPIKRRTASNASRANSLDGKTWTRYSISVWSDIRKTREETALGHPAMFPAELPSRLIQMLMRENDSVVLDPFLGVGSTLLAAQQQGKQGIGLEISSDYCDIARGRLKQTGVFEREVDRCEVYKADARDLLTYVQPSSIDLCVTSPPYWNILLEKRTADYKERRDYGLEEADLGKILKYADFLAALEEIFRDVYEVLRPGAFCCVIVMDLRKKNVFYPYHSDVAIFMQKIGFIFDDIVIWDRRHEYNNMRPLGYPYVFRVNKAHEYILLFAKPRS